MNNRKKDIIQFMVWMRNGICFCSTWFLVLVLAFNSIFGVMTILTNDMIKMVIWITGAVFIFNMLFTRLIITRWRFVKRLTCFMVIISLYECLGGYWFKFFSGRGTSIQWFVYIGVVFVLYLICIAIYQRYSKRQGEIYTQALQKYQQNRDMHKDR